MKLTDEKLDSLKASMSIGVRISVWISVNSIEGLRPRDALMQLREKYGEEEVKNTMRAMRNANFGIQIGNITKRLISRDNLTVDMVSSLIANIQAALVDAEAKRDELTANE